ncbi:MAG: fused response regulator/phosphatase [Candidatus Riflebacteria bacterium]|nr:fused response regulator/phosphatase [Candidatus Riflebacteria bacterium]
MSKHVQGKMNILVVDDAPDNLLLLEAILESESFENIFLASSAREAYEYIGLVESPRNARIDMVLMDIMMPEISGIEAIREIRSHADYQDIPIVVVSARSETQDLVEAFDAGAVDYVTKPIKELELVARIRSMLRLKSETDHRKFHEAELETLAQELEEKNRMLSQVLEELREDMAAAGNMQRSLLPDKRISIPGLNFSWYYETSENIGGDLLNIMPLDNGMAALFILDVSGHGIQSAMLAVSVHRMLSAWEGENSILRLPDGSPRSPAEVANELNAEFMLDKNNYQYFTMIYGIIDLKKQTLTYCRAGHTPLLLQNRDGAVIVCRDGNVPVGLTEDCIYEEFTLRLAPNDRVILYSDGITEARRHGSKEFFGDDNFLDLLQKTRSLPVDQAVQGIIGDFKDWLGDTRPSDDITLLVIEPD